MTTIENATSLGGTRTKLESRYRWEGDRCPEGLLRLSVGLEDGEALWADLEQALAHGLIRSPALLGHFDVAFPPGRLRGVRGASRARPLLCVESTQSLRRRLRVPADSAVPLELGLLCGEPTQSGASAPDDCRPRRSATRYEIVLNQHNVLPDRERGLSRSACVLARSLSVQSIQSLARSRRFRQWRSRARPSRPRTGRCNVSPPRHTVGTCSLHASPHDMPAPEDTLPGRPAQCR